VNEQKPIIGIIGAMEEEVAELKAKLGNPQTAKTAGLDFVSGKLHGRDVVVVRSGIGKVNAAICAQTLITVYGAGAVINTGVAGGLADEVHIGDIVVSNDLVQHDMDVRHFGYPRGAVPRLNDGFFKADACLVRLAMDAGKGLAAGINVMTGRIASGDCFVSERGKKEDIAETFGAACVEMEGAAIAQVCYLNDVPFVAVRSISDKADEEAGVSFDEFVLQAAKNSCGLVENMIKHM
jgi:adenosylhomocysteine nucleosidase